MDVEYKVALPHVRALLAYIGPMGGVSYRLNFGAHNTVGLSYGRGVDGYGDLNCKNSCCDPTGA